MSSKDKVRRQLRQLIAEAINCLEKRDIHGATAALRSSYDVHEIVTEKKKEIPKKHPPMKQNPGRIRHREDFTVPTFDIPVFDGRSLEEIVTDIE